jgi:hypothetical protein
MAITKCSSNKGFSGKSSILPRLNFGAGGQISSPQSLTAYSLSRYAACYRYRTNSQLGRYKLG